MITEKQKQIIKLLLTSKEGYNVNQIARILDISVSWTHETLKTLEKEKLLVSAKSGNAILFRLNWENPKTEKICDFILLDTNEKPVSKPKEHELQTNVKETQVAPKPTYQNFYNKQLNQGYASPMASNIADPYRQAAASSNKFSYTVAPVGEQGVSNVLFSYAKSGAFSHQAVDYSSNEGYYGKSISVPSGTLGSRISKNVEGFTMVQHTSQHKSTVGGCRYCGPEIKL